MDDRPELGEKLTFPVVSYTIGWDSVSTKNPSQVILGNYDDPFLVGQMPRLFQEFFFLNLHQILVQVPFVIP